MNGAEITEWLERDEKRAEELVSALIAGDQGKVADLLAGILGTVVGGPVAGAAAATLMQRVREWASANDPTRQLLCAEADERARASLVQKNSAFMKWLCAAIAAAISTEMEAIVRADGDETRAIVSDGIEQLARINQAAVSGVKRILAHLEEEPGKLAIDDKLNERFDVVRGLLQEANPEAARDVLQKISTECDIASASPAARLRWLNQSAVAAMQLGELNAAVSFLEKAQVIDPKNLQVLTNLAMAKLSIGDAAAATRWSREAAKHNPNDASAWGVRVQCDPSVTTDEIPTAVAQSIPVVTARACLLMDEGKWLAAVELLRPLVTGEVDPQVRTLYGNALWHLADVEGSDPANQTTLLEELVREEQRVVDATRDVRSLLRQDALGLQGAALRRLRRHSEATIALANALRYAGADTNLSNQLAAAHLDDSAPTQAERVLSKLKDSQRDALTHALLGEAALARGDRVSAEEAARRAVEALASTEDHGNGYPQAAAHLATLAVGLCSKSLAGEIAALIDTNTSDFGLRMVLARLAQVREEAALVFDHYRAALALSNDPGVACEFADYLRRHDQHSDALGLLESYRNHLPAPGLKIYVQVACAAEEYIRAHDVVEALWREGLREPWLVRARAHIADRHDDVNSAIESLQAWIMLDQEDPEPARCLASFLVRAGRNDEADEILRRLRTAYKLGAEDQLRIAELHIVRQLVPEAMELAWNGLRQSPHSTDVQRAYLSLASNWLGTAEYNATPEAAGPGVAVRWKADDEAERTILIADTEPAKTDFDEVAADHAFAAAVSGLGVGASFSLRPNSAFEKRAVITMLMPKYAHGFQWVIEKLQADPANPAVHSFRVADDSGNIDFGALERIARGNARGNDELIELYSAHVLPLGFLATRRHESILEAYARVSRDVSRRLFVEFSDLPGVTEAVAACNTPALVLTRTALLTLATLDLLHFLKRLPGRIVTAQGLVDELENERLKFVDLAARGGMSLGLSDDRLAINQTSPEVGQQLLKSHDETIAWVRANTEIRPQPLGRTQRRIETWEDVGAESLAATRLAAAEQASLYADDLGLRLWAKADMEVSGFSTYALLLWSFDGGHITRPELNRLLVSLLHLNHSFIPVNRDVLAAAFERGQYALDNGVQQVLKQLRGGFSELPGAARVAAESLRDLSLRDTVSGPHFALGEAILESVFHDREPEQVLAAVRSELERTCRLLPLHLDALQRKLDGFYRRKLGTPLIQLR